MNTHLKIKTILEKCRDNPTDLVKTWEVLALSKNSGASIDLLKFQINSGYIEGWNLDLRCVYKDPIDYLFDSDGKCLVDENSALDTFFKSIHLTYSEALSAAKNYIPENENDPNW